jgi:hypothetical protein
VDECKPLPRAPQRCGRGTPGARAQGLTLVPISAQLELTLPLSAQLKITLSPIQPKLIRGCVPKVLKLSSNMSDVFPKALKLSSEVSECKPLPVPPVPHVEPRDVAEDARVLVGQRLAQARVTAALLAPRQRGLQPGAHTRSLSSST